jgi:uncharacterized protein (DUF1501 family)
MNAAAASAGVSSSQPLAVAPKCVLLAGGGSGGHISPGLAIAERMKAIDPGCRPVFACSQRPIDAQMLTEAGAEHVAIAAEPMSMRPRKLLRCMRSFVRGRADALRMIDRMQPSWVVSLGGFDHHDGLIGSHETLLGQVDFAMDAFYKAMVELGVQNNVTAFTASDFGRTLSSNGDGSDHGWGSHHFIVGGGVNGGRFYGRAPQVSVTSTDQVGQGRLLPSTSVDEFSATLAKWFGVSTSELPSVSPNIGRFASPDLGFMKAAQTALSAKV